MPALLAATLFLFSFLGGSHLAWAQDEFVEPSVDESVDASVDASAEAADDEPIAEPVDDEPIAEAADDEPSTAEAAPKLKPKKAKSAQTKNTSAKAEAEDEDAGPIEVDQEPLPQIKRSEKRPPPPTWTSRQESTRIRHPLAKKGLVKITKDRTYIFKVEESKQDRSSSFKFGMFDPNDLENPDTGDDFADLYDDREFPLIMIDYEWQFWRNPLGKFGAKLGSGLFFANGNGRFREGSTNEDLTPKEVFTLVVFPNSASLVYHLQFWDKQLLVPYGEGGGLLFAFSEFRDDNKPPKFGAAPAMFGAGGLAINLRFLDAKSVFDLDREYGINNMFLTLEYRIIVGLSENFDFSSTVASAGFMFEF